MVAMAVLLIGSMGLLSLHSMGQRMNGDARVMTRATLKAHDLLTQIQTWDYTDSRLLQATRSTADLADTDHRFEMNGFTTTDYDHDEADLGAWNGIPTADVESLGFTRYWNVEDQVDSMSRTVGKRVAVIVRWGENGRWRRLVLVSYLCNPHATLM
jgi:hypothetical protein